MSHHRPQDCAAMARRGLEDVTAEHPLLRRALRLALWAGQRLGHAGGALVLYAFALTETAGRAAGEGALLGRIVADFAARGLSIDEAELRRRLAGHEATA